MIPSGWSDNPDTWQEALEKDRRIRRFQSAAGRQGAGSDSFRGQDPPFARQDGVVEGPPPGGDRVRGVHDAGRRVERFCLGRIPHARPLQRAYPRASHHHLQAQRAVHPVRLVRAQSFPARLAPERAGQDGPPPVRHGVGTLSEVGASQPIHVVCGYRALATNEMLRTRSSGVAKHSQHTQGKAMDMFIPACRSIGCARSGSRCSTAASAGIRPPAAPSSTSTSATSGRGRA